MMEGKGEETNEEEKEARHHTEVRMRRQPTEDCDGTGAGRREEKASGQLGFDRVLTDQQISLLIDYVIQPIADK
ncbi:hypothetical protein PAMP_008270 [Pampus punctatissimus]